MFIECIPCVLCNINEILNKIIDIFFKKIYISIHVNYLLILFLETFETILISFYPEKYFLLNLLLITKAD